jgi:dimethylaniline monooxygenase (N-oxide forming)
VVVIGAGSSGSDIAGEVGKTAEQVDISAKSGVWFVPHKANGRPLDNNLTRFSNLLPASVRKRFFENVVLDCYRTIGFEEEIMTAALALPEFDPKLTRVTPGTLILQQIRDGKVHVKGDIQRIEPDGVCYKDGSKTTAGVLIFCTGYAPSLPFMDPSIIEVKEDNTFGLYKHIFHPEIDNLAFLAQCRVGGPVFPVMEMQARWAARVFTGTADLPSPAARKDSINEHFAACRKHGKNPMQVSYGPYMDDIARQFGVRPKLFAHPGLFRKLMFGPILPAQFRLDGPGNSAKSREIIEQY